jgi:hypothetical protein
MEKMIIHWEKMSTLNHFILCNFVGSKVEEVVEVK